MSASPDTLQLGFGFDEPAPSDETTATGESRDEEPWEAEETARIAERFFERLRSLGLRHVRRVVLTRNLSILVSVKGFELRVHEGYVDAPTDVHVQVVRFVMAKEPWERQAAREALVTFLLSRNSRPRRAPERTHPEHEPLAEQLAEWHTRLNGERFGEQLALVPIRVSRRMVRRLGHYAPAVEGGGAEIAISARHIARDGFAAALETLLHEMVHQWQHETGLTIDHGAEFRRKCREVGAIPSAKRAVC